MPVIHANISHMAQDEQIDNPSLRIAGTRRQLIIKLAEEIQTQKNRASVREALQAEHDAIELILRDLWQGVLSGGSRVEIIEILNSAIKFCETHFEDEEDFMRTDGNVYVDAHAAAHQRLLAQFVAARRSASGEGLSLAVLEAADLLHKFHQHVRMYDRHCAESKVSA